MGYARDAGNWERDLKRGEIGEQMFMKLCDSEDFKYIDVSLDKKYQDIDTDFIVRNRNSVDKLCEVKWDYKVHNTNNFFVETISSINIMSKGWLYKTQAEFIFYGSSIDMVFHVFRTDEMKEYLEKYNPREVTAGNTRGALVNVFNYKEKGYICPILTIPQ